MRLRQPMAVVALVGLALHLALHLVLLLGLAAAARGDGERWAGDLAFTLVDPVLLLLVAALVLACWVAVPAPRARGLTVAALVLVALTLVAFVAAGVAAVIVGETVFLAILLPQSVASLVTGIVALGTVIALLRRPAALPAPALRTGPIPVELGSEQEGEPVPDPELQPTWSSDQAVGTVWRRAGDASPQTAATDWDESGEAGGWWSTERDRVPLPEPPGRTES